MNQGFFWDIFRDICAKVATLTIVFFILSLIYGLNSMDFYPFMMVCLFIPVFWFASSWVRRDG